MRPNGIESLSALRAALAEVLAPELQTPFAQDTASTLQMLLESLSAEWDTLADDLRRDNSSIVGLLRDARAAFGALDSNAESLAIISIIDEALAAPEPGSLVVSALSARHDMLGGALEQVLMALEDRVGEPGFEGFVDLRHAVYEHLRDVAARGWSFWDVASFREYMNRYRTERSQMTA